MEDNALRRGSLWMPLPDARDREVLVEEQTDSSSFFLPEIRWKAEAQFSHLKRIRWYELSKKKRIYAERNVIGFEDDPVRRAAQLALGRRELPCDPSGRRKESRRPAALPTPPPLPGRPRTAGRAATCSPDLEFPGRGLHPGQSRGTEAGPGPESGLAHAHSRLPLPLMSPSPSPLRREDEGADAKTARGDDGEEGAERRKSRTKRRKNWARAAKDVGRTERGSPSRRK
ncbi:hypothetical protein KM043_010439 [Ampulex compressa]|nr:hypothetical protein KM043_010439 [Ampulex compressa]